ncbi:hypothetical protein AU210_016550 [Fusarium oxysporum f. sp. radicis-cucumerinum]|uniref:chitinase n=1 Tax=Fusarium oxysporum f. sp. radicis-cucumerinum TaxID=327505 RepID=A0A2H3G1S9_FUSOX|nr:hypothetical protein AU210_016550 [Fusarium oxysporum f. sp. radicis-cucumerinum]
MRLTWATSLVALLLTSTPFTVAEDIHCDKNKPCEVGCCGTNNVCGTGPDYCSKAKCINSCTYKAECNPGKWDSQYFNATKCPLNVCCSKFGFCGTTEEFCGKETVKRPSCNIGSQSVKRVIGYYGSGGATRKCNPMIPDAFPQGIYTHIYFAFGSIDPKSFKVVPANAGDQQLYSQLSSLKTRDSGQELWLSIGGWAFSDKGSPTATTFSDLVNADETRQNVFFASLTLFMQTWGFTGIDIDWEYPVDKDRSGRQSDFKAYPRFLKRLKSALGDYKYGLSVTLPTSYWYLQHFDLENIEPSVDWFNVMSYDLHGAWDIGNKWTGAFVGAHTNLTEITSSLDLLWRNKVSPSKVVLGLAFYGRSVTLASSSCSEPGCPYLSAGDAGCSGEAGILFNSEISDLIREKKLRPKLYKDAAIKTIQWNNDQWVSYDDRDTWKLKANFLKSQCLSGVLVWAVDYDDDKHSYSNGLAAALGIKVNVDSGSGLTIKLPDKREDSQDFCYFTNCGQTCPSGYTEIARGGKDSEIMLDATECLPGQDQVQTLCCPKSSKVPKCQWRGYQGNDHCPVGCNAGEVAVGTHHQGCKKSGWQTACCEATDSTGPWSKCGWTVDCYDDDDSTCPKGFSSFVVGSRGGFGGQKSCKKGKKYNYCCTETPKPFKNCEWVGHEVSFPNEQACTNTCPHGSTRIAAQDISTSWSTSGYLAHTDKCTYGFEAYCCAGDKESNKDERDIIVYQDKDAKEFDYALQRFLRDPVCPDEEIEFGGDDGLSTDEGLSARNLLLGRATDNSAVLAVLLPIMGVWVTSREPRLDLTEIYNRDVRAAGYAQSAANLTTFQQLLYQSDWNGRPRYSGRAVARMALCDLAESREGLENLATVPAALCEVPSSTGSEAQKRDIQARTINVNVMTDRGKGGVQPSAAYIFQAIKAGHLSLHYLRWLPPSPTSRQVILEVAYWIGPSPGVEDPANSYRNLYRDRSHRNAVDRWVVFHFHIPLDANTFWTEPSGVNDYYLGVSSFGMYHSQGTHRPNPPRGYRGPVDYRAEWVYSSSYAGGSSNTGALTNYNQRREPFNCRIPEHGPAPGPAFYLGRDYTSQINDLITANRDPQLAVLINEFGMGLHQAGVFRSANLARIWPIARNGNLPPAGSSWGDQEYSPGPQAFQINFDLNGARVNNVQNADP